METLFGCERWEVDSTTGAPRHRGAGRKFLEGKEAPVVLVFGCPGGEKEKWCSSSEQSSGS